MSGGVKLIGATTRYVTADPDEDPIIEQDIAGITPAGTAEDHVSNGCDVKNHVLARGVHAHFRRLSPRPVAKTRTPASIQKKAILLGLRKMGSTHSRPIAANGA